MKATALLFYGHTTLNSQLNKLFIKHNNTQLTVRIHVLLGLKPCCAQFATWQIYNPLQNRSLTPNRSLDRNVLISIILLLLLAVLCPSAAVFSSVPSRRSPLRLRQNGRKTVCHKYIIRLSSNDRFGFNYLMNGSRSFAAWSAQTLYCKAKNMVR